jgi:predicted phage terminase large subunit-like protein
MPNEISTRLEKLPRTRSAKLRSLWQELFEKPVHPKLRRDLMIPIYRIDVFSRRLNYPELKRAVKDQASRYKPNAVIIEDRASGIQLILDLKHDGVFGIKPYSPPPSTDKVLRLHAQTAEFENGRVILPRSAPWRADFVNELTSFPGLQVG